VTYTAIGATTNGAQTKDGGTVTVNPDGTFTYAPNQTDTNATDDKDTAGLLGRYRTVTQTTISYPEDNSASLWRPSA
jgi:hypothetical protein